MIRFICPECDKNLSVSDEKAGKIAVCPKCSTRIIIPELDPPPEAVTAEPPRRRLMEDEERPASSRRRRDEYDEDEPPRLRRDNYDDDDDIPEAERARPRKRRRKKRKQSLLTSGGHLMIGGIYISPYMIIMASLIAIAFPLLALSLVVPGIGYIALVMGICMGLAGRIWFLSVAFSDDSTQGMLCLWLWLYSLVYLFTNFEETRRPFFLEITGGFIAGFAWATLDI